MTYSMYIGRVGALAVALGIGAAVATGPGIAFAQDGDAGPSNTGTESPSDESPSDLGTQPPAAGDGAGGGGTDGEGGGGGANIEPPDMQVSGSTVDTGTHDDNIVAGEGAGTDADVEEQTEGGVDGVEGNDDLGSEIDGEAPAAENGSGSGESGLPGARGSGSGGTGVTPPNTQNFQQQLASNTGFTNKESQRLAGGGADYDTTDTDTQSFKATALDNSTAEADTFSALALAEAAPAPQNPISALLALPLRIVSDVLTAIVGGPNTPPGENPLFLGLLAFVRRQFAPFERTFSNQAPEITVSSVEEEPDGTFTITVDADDPDGDELTFNVTGGVEGTVEQTGASTFTYTPGDDFDGDTFTIAASDPGGLFGFNRKTTTVTVEVNPEDDATVPEVTQPPTQQPDGTFEAELQFDPEKVTDVTIAEGFEPRYWTVEEVYNAETGELELKLTPTQAGMLRAALGLDTTDSVGLEVTTTETATVETFSMRAVSFAALAEQPDYTLNLPQLPTGHFEVNDPIVTSPDAEDPTQTFPAGTVVTDRYAYVVNSNLLSGDSSTLSVIGADPENADYLQLVDEIDLGAKGLLLTQAGDRLYISTGDTVQVVDTDGANPLVETDDNELLAPIDLGENGGAIPVASPDGKTVYVINQQFGKIYVIDADPANTGTTYHTVIDEIVVAAPPTNVDNGDGTRTVSGQFPLSAAFNADGTRMYLVRDGQTYTQSTTTGEISNFTFSGEIVTIDTTTNEVIGIPLALDGDYGYFASSDGKYLYVPALTMNGFDPTQDTDISQITGSINVIDVQDPDNPVIVANLPTGNMPVNVAFSPDKSLAYVVDAGEGTVWVIDTVNQEVLDLDPADGMQGLVFDAEPSAALGQVFNVIAASPDGTRLFVTNIGKGTVIPLEFVQDVV